MSRDRNLVGKLLTLVCLGALLFPSIVSAKASKRSRAQKRAPKAESGEASDRPRTASTATRRASFRTGAAVRVGTRTKRQHRVRARRGVRGTVDEHIHVRKGDTVENVLATRGVGMLEARDWIDATTDVYDLRKIRPRHGLTLRFDRETRALESIRYEVDQKHMLIVEQAGESVTARLEDLPYFVEVKGVAGRIAHGLREDTVAAGVPAHIAADVADIFGWDVDVAAGLQPGDEFRVIYENIWEVGMAVPQAGKVLAAELVIGGKSLTAVLFENEDGEGGYYAPSGEAVSRSFLRYPVEFTEISSDFSIERFHPIRREWRPHWGVDLAAPYGTPVRAAASGVVSQSGWETGLGQTVRLDHASGVSSAYGHLAEIAPAMRPGTSVERGQVLGYVGSTGLSTGPHLHYEITRDGVHMNPLEFTCDREPAIAPPLVRQFDRTKREAGRQLAVIPRTSEPTSLSLSTSLFQAAE